MKTFEEDLLGVQTEPHLAKTIVQQLNIWLYNLPHPPISPEPLNTAIDHQTIVGWDALLEGCVASTWSLVQMPYLQSLGSHQSLHRWLTALAIKAIKVAWGL